MRNGDAHLKNFGLIYDNINNATLAPTYDMLSMSVYAPALANDNDADDGLAINFEGSKRWLTPKTIKALATQCLINSKQLKEWEIQVADALVQTSKKVIEFLNQHPEDDFGPLEKRMLELWAIGLASFDRLAALNIKYLSINN